MNKKNTALKVLLTFFCGVLLLSVSFFISYKVFSAINEKKAGVEASKTFTPQTSTAEAKTAPAETPKQTEVIISAAGDCTIGTDDNFAYESSLPAMVKKHNNDYSYLFKNVAQIFEKDDLTLVNLETTFTKSNVKIEKSGNVTFHFKGNPEFAKALTLGSIEGVNLANNHIYDYGNQGFKDTVDTLEKEKISYFGEGYNWKTEIKGQKFGFLGYRGFNYDNSTLSNMKKDIETLKAENRIVVVSFHWGEEGSYNYNNSQSTLAHNAIDYGADLVLGHHPHVVQGMEQYKNRFIVYSLGNFCFGGNSNPKDKDTFIAQIKFNFTDNTLTGLGLKAIPCSLSSTVSYNDYCPTVLQGSSGEKLLAKLSSLSPKLGFKLNDTFNDIDIKK